MTLIYGGSEPHVDHWGSNFLLYKSHMITFPDQEDIKQVIEILCKSNQEEIPRWEAVKEPNSLQPRSFLGLQIWRYLISVPLGFICDVPVPESCYWI